MTIEQEILRFHEKLTSKRINKRFHYKSVLTLQCIIIIIGCIILHISCMCLLFRSTYPILEMYETLIVGIAIIDSIIIFITMLNTDEFRITINERKKKVDLLKMKQDAIYLYLIKQKYISRNKDNSYFYSPMLQITQFNSTIFFAKIIFSSITLIISVGCPIVSFILGENANIQIKIASIFIVISTSIFIGILFYILKRKDYNRSLRYQELHLLILNIQLEDSIKRKKGRKKY